MNRRVRQHDAKTGTIRRHRGRDVGVGQLGQKRDRLLYAHKSIDGVVRDLAERADGVDVRSHDRERLLLAVLALAKSADSVFVRRVAGEMEAAKPLDGDELPTFQSGDRGSESIFAEQLTGVSLAEGEAWPAVRAGDGLGMEAPVVDVVVFIATVVAHRERRHAGHRAVVRHAADDRVARAAVGAVDEWVSAVPVRGIEQLSLAVGASRHVRRDEDGPGIAPLAGQYLEAGSAKRIEPLGNALLDERDRRLLGPEVRDEAPQVDRRALNLDVNAARVVEDRSRELVATGEAVDEWTEAHALDNAQDPDEPSLDLVGTDLLCYASAHLAPTAQVSRGCATASAGVGLNGRVSGAKRYSTDTSLTAS